MTHTHAPDPHPSLTIGVSMPPYREVVPLAPPSAGPLGRASLLVLDVRLGGDDTHVKPLLAAVADARRLHPAAPVIVRVPQVTPDALRLAHRASHLGVRALVGAGEPLAAVLRPLLTRPDDLAGDLMKWLALHGHVIAEGMAGIARRIVDLAPEHARLSDLLAALGQSERTVRHRFRSAGRLGPREWHQGARALDAALRLQAEPDARLLEFALGLGYSGTSGVTRLLTRAFGVTPAAIRGTLGWEWLAERWYRRATAEPQPRSARNGNDLPLHELSLNVN